MKKVSKILIGALACVSVSSAIVRAAEAGDAAIPFVNYGSIRNWTASDDDKVYMQAANGQWYDVELIGSCPGLPFAVGIGVSTGPLDTFDQFSSIIVDGRRCPVSSVTRIAAAPKERS